MRVAVLVRLTVVVDVPLVESSARAAPAARTAKQILESCILAMAVEFDREDIQRCVQGWRGDGDGLISCVRLFCKE